MVVYDQQKWSGIEHETGREITEEHARLERWGMESNSDVKAALTLSRGKVFIEELPLATTVLLIANCLLFVAFVQDPVGLETFGLRATSLEAGQVWQLVTAMLFHFDVMHLCANEYGLFVLGRSVEKTFKRAKTAYLYFSSGLVGNVASYFLLPAYTVTLGASGAIFGLMGADLATTVVKRTRPTGRSAGATLAYVAITFFRSIGPQINVIAHLAGLCFGFASGYLLAQYSRDTS
jgi:rhomboid protease GluP